MTEDESPPQSLGPQVTTEPSSLRAAKALAVENISTTPEVRSELTEDEYTKKKLRNQVTTEPSDLRAAKESRFENILVIFDFPIIRPRRFVTFVSEREDLTKDEYPPYWLSPQVTTEPFSF